MSRGQRTRLRQGVLAPPCLDLANLQGKRTGDLACE